MLNKRRKVYDETIQVKDYETYLGDIITNNGSNDRNIENRRNQGIEVWYNLTDGETGAS